MPPSPARASRELAALDPVFATLVERHGPARFGPRPRATERFGTLARAIAYQQLAGRAAGAIWGRVLEQMPEGIDPAALLGLGEARLREAGLSGAKTRSLLDLAQHVIDGRLDLARAGYHGDEEVIGQLTAVRGIGRWTAQMFLMSALWRPDVWPVTDLGVRAGYAAAHGLDELPAPRELESLGDRLRPYRSVAAWYCWRAADVDEP